MWLRIYVRKSWSRGPWLIHREGGQRAWPPTWPSRDLRTGPQTESQCSLRLARWGVCVCASVARKGRGALVHPQEEEEKQQRCWRKKYIKTPQEKKILFVFIT